MSITSMFRRLAKIVCKAAVASSAGFFAPAHAHVAPPPLEHAVWVFGSATANPVSDAAARQLLISRAAASHVTSLYVSVYRSSDAQPTNTSGRRMYEDADIADLIVRAHRSAPGIQVYAAYGAPDWPSLGCAAIGFPAQRIAEVLAYNAQNPSAAFDGIMLDVEPPPPPPPATAPLGAADYVALLTQYQCLQQQAGALRLGVAIRFGWKDPVVFNGGAKPFYQHVLDLIPPTSPVVVMGYRDFAGVSVSTSDGVVASDADQVAYAAGVGRTILAGLETGEPVGILGKETFFEEGQSVLDDVAQVVVQQFGFPSALGGFAIHNYGASYLKGTSAKWPAVNPNLPQYFGASAEELATPRGGPVTVTPAGPVNGTNVTVRFQDVTTPAGSSSNTYVTALDSGTLASLPADYLSFNGLSFDISTTATSSAPVTICFSNMDVGTADFASLRVLHYTAGGIVDDTVLSGADAPNTATRTVCAKVTTFSPFRIGQCVSKSVRGNGSKTERPEKKCGKPDKD